MNPTADRPRPAARILVVDDQRDNREVLAIVLAHEGFSPVTAASGEEALAIVAREPPDMILLDIMMPGMNGYQVVAAIKRNDATRSIPVIMVSALHDRDARALASAAGAEDFVSKPVDHADLCARVRAHLPLTLR